MLVYIASPISTYADRKRYDQNVERVQAHFPTATLLPARDLYRCTANWCKRWFDVLPSLDALVFFTDIEGWIGAGVCAEIVDSLAAGKQVYYLSEEGRLLPFNQIALKLCGKNYICFAKVILEEALHETAIV